MVYDAFSILVKYEALKMDILVVEAIMFSVITLQIIYDLLAFFSPCASATNI